MEPLKEVGLMIPADLQLYRARVAGRFDDDIAAVETVGD
jgi:hypothetical protein